jgi:hypothetical protein
VKERVGDVADGKSNQQQGGEGDQRRPEGIHVAYS